MSLFVCQGGHVTRNDFTWSSIEFGLTPQTPQTKAKGVPIDIKSLAWKANTAFQAYF